jgi:uncharacterized RDD family membrane protein YckC
MRSRRLAACGVDYGMVAAYLAVLVVIGALGRAVGVLPQRITTPADRVIAQLLVIVVLTAPVTIWFAWWEARPRGATLGKRRFGLCVNTLDGAEPSWPRSLLRSSAKIAVPWELAHTAVWNILAWPGPQTPVNAVLLTVANGLLVLNVAMPFIGTGRPLYDRLAGTVVRPVSEPPDLTRGAVRRART